MNKSILVWTLSLISVLLLLGPSRLNAQGFQKQEVLQVSLHYKDSAVTLNSVEKQQGFLPDYLNQPDTGYILQIIDSSGQKLFDVKFNFPLEIITEGGQQQPGSIRKLSEADRILTIPSLESAQKFQVFDSQGQMILEHNLAVIVDPELPNRGATPPKTKTPFPLPVIFGALLLISFSVIVFAILKKRNSLPQE